MVIAMGSPSITFIAAATARNTSYALHKSPDDFWIVLVVFSVAIAITVGIWLGINQK